MKKIICILILPLLMSLSGCNLLQGNVKEPVIFYYPRQEIICGQEDGVISKEIREASGHTDDLEYLIAVYLQGPMAKNLKNPFPAGTKLVSILQKDDCLYLVLNEAISQVKNIDLSTLGVCLAKTCFELTDFSSIHIDSTPLSDGNAISITIHRDKMILIDDTPLPAENTTDSK